MLLSSLFLFESWGELLGDIAARPSRYLFWVIIFLVLLFMMSRLNNVLEVKGVNRAIYITRGLVGSFMYFIVAPIVIFILINIVAIIYGVPRLDISFLGSWIGLTMSSYWWLLKCFFGSADIIGQKEMYTIHSVIRMLWVLIPITLIWMRMTKTRVGKLLILPMIIGVFVVARFKKAEETFVTKDLSPQVIAKIPIIGSLIMDDSGSPGLQPTSRKILAGVLIVVIGGGFFMGLRTQRRIPGIILVAAGSLGLMLITPATGSDKKNQKYKDDHPVNVSIDSLIRRLDSLYAADSATIEVYELTVEISRAYEIQYQEGFIMIDTIWTRCRLCEKYREYFYDHCQYEHHPHH